MLAARLETGRIFFLSLGKRKSERPQAMKHPPQRMVLVAPFTSLLDMARRSVGGPLSHSRSDRYDNRASLRAVRAHGLPPLAILRGQNDRLIPNSMGAELAALAPGSRFELVPGADHGDVIEVAQQQLRSC
jgi:pimeloyl-ACP methyl ester carboxylesterase